METEDSSSLPKVTQSGECRARTLRQASNFLYHNYSTQKRWVTSVHASTDLQARARHWITGTRKMPKLRSQRGRQVTQGLTVQAGSSGLQHLQICMAVRDEGRREVFLLPTESVTLSYGLQSPEIEHLIGSLNHYETPCAKLLSQPIIQAASQTNAHPLRTNAHP